MTVHLLSSRIGKTTAVSSSRTNSRSSCVDSHCQSNADTSLLGIEKANEYGVQGPRTFSRWATEYAISAYFVQKPQSADVVLL